MRSPDLTRSLLLAGVVGPVVFVAVFLIEGATRPGYSAWGNYVSQLATGEGGWVQVVTFLFCGACVSAFAVGARWTLRSGPAATWGPRLLLLFGAALVTAGLFVTDPALGYPPGAPIRGEQSASGAVHGIAGLVSFSSLAAAAFVFSRRFTGAGRAFSLATGAIVLGFFLVSTFGCGCWSPTSVPTGWPVGLFQRIAVVTGWTWVALLALRLRQRPG
jgi:hypothetical protein